MIVGASTLKNAPCSSSDRAVALYILFPIFATYKTDFFAALSQFPQNSFFRAVSNPSLLLTGRDSIIFLSDTTHLVYYYAFL